LLYTDYTSMLMYCLNAPTLQRYFDQVVLGLPLSTEVTLEILQRVLRKTAISRRVSSRLGLHTAPVDLTDDCTVAGSDVSFDTERFVERLLNKAAASNRLSEYLAEFERIGATLPNSPLFWVHEEDLIDFLHWLVVRLRGASRTVPKHLLGKTLLLAVPLVDAAAQPMFVELIRRLTIPSRAA
jgi:hypothetical protein